MIAQRVVPRADDQALDSAVGDPQLRRPSRPSPIAQPLLKSARPLSINLAASAAQKASRATEDSLVRGWKGGHVECPEWFRIDGTSPIGRNAERLDAVRQQLPSGDIDVKGFPIRRRVATEFPRMRHKVVDLRKSVARNSTSQNKAVRV